MTGAFERIAGIALAAVLLTACGGATPEATNARRGRRCAASCDRMNVRGPLAAEVLEDGRVAILVGRADGALLYGEASVRGGRWRPRSLHLNVALESFAGDLAAVPDGDGLWVAHGSDAGPVVSRVSRQGVAPVGPLSDGSSTGDGEAPVSVDLVRDEAQSLAFCAWLPRAEGAAAPRLVALRDGEPQPVLLPFEAHRGHAIALALTTDGVVAAYASDAGVQIAGGPVAGVLRPSDRESRAVAAAGDGERAWVAWAELAGVFLVELRGGALGEVRPIDRGERTGEPAHRVGAGLSIRNLGDELLLGYQDQTAGALVTARAARLVLRQSHVDGRWTRGMEVALVEAGGAPFALDVALSARPALRGSLRATRLR